MNLRYAFACLAVALATSAHAQTSWIIGAGGVADNYRPIHITASASQTAFSVTWVFEQACDLRVYKSADADVTSDEILTTPTCGASSSAAYSVTGAGIASGGVVTLVTPASAGDRIVIERDDAVDRTTNVAGYSVTTDNTYENRQTVQQQQVEERATRRPPQIGPGDDLNASDGNPWVRVQVPHVSADNAGDPLCFLSKTNADLGFRATFCKGAGGGACADCPIGECEGGDNDGDDCASEEDCPGGECVGFEDCDYISVADGTYVCETGDTCPTGCGDGGGGEPCLDCGPVGHCVGGTNDGNPCTDDAECPGGGTCTFDDHVCFGGVGDGDACTNDVDCDGGICRPNTNVCHGGANDGDLCTDDADCPGGFCVDPDDRCDACSAPEGLFCTNGYEDVPCLTNTDCSPASSPPSLCADPCGTCGGLCVDNADCGDGCTCDVDNVCLGGTNDGLGCTDDTDCPGVCASLACVDDGEVCATNTDCGGVCAPEFTDEVCDGGTNDGDPCTDDADCPAGGTCDNRDGVGVRGPTTAVTDNAIALWDGTSAAFIKESRVTIGSTGFMRNVAAIQYSAVVSTATDELVTWQYPPTSTQAERQAAGAWYEFPNESPTHLTTGALPTQAQFAWIGLDNTFCSSAGRTPTRWSAMSYPVTAFAPGVSTNSQLVAQVFFTEPVVCPDDFAGSYVKNTTTFTVSKAYSIQKNNSEIGTATFPTTAASEASPVSATLVTAGAAVTTFAAGDRLDIQAPASADATGGNLSFNLLCYRSATDECN